MSGERNISAAAEPPVSKAHEVLVADLRRWADARDRRYEQDHPHGAHGKTGTAKLRAAADQIADDAAVILRLAQALRLLRDTGNGAYTRNVASYALEAAGIPDPPADEWEL